MYLGNMAGQAPHDVEKPKLEPMPTRLDRVLERADKLSPRQRAEALASAGIIKDNEITSVAQRLGSKS